MKLNQIYQHPISSSRMIVLVSVFLIELIVPLLTQWNAYLNVSFRLTLTRTNEIHFRKKEQEAGQ